MTPAEYIASQDPTRQTLLANIHNVIVNNDKTVVAEVGKMMGKDMILYNCKIFKYGLASVKEHMSLHILPMYGSPIIYGKYSKLLDKAKFQKGCINFKSAEVVPLSIVEELIKDCAPIDMAALYAKNKKK